MNDSKMNLVDLKEKPYFLDDEQIYWVEETIKNMSIEEKIGQFFINMVANEEERREENIKKILDTYHPGGIRYHNAPKDTVWEMAKCLQDNSKIPLLIASNCEAGGNGGVKGGTALANGAALAAIDDENAVYEMAKAAAAECEAIGCNWNFAPVVDLTYNWRNTIVQLRAFNDNPDDVIKYSKKYFKAMREYNLATCMKHFPGDGTEENDQHLLMGVNEMSVEEWDESFGKVYKELIDDGVMTIMAGHIALPAYSKFLNPDLKDEDILPATLAPELINGLLKGKLGFNGMVLTDASHMIGMFGATDYNRSEQVPRAIAAGCDMFLFFNDRDEDFEYMMNGYKNGIITEERLTDALRRILGVKAKLNLHKKQKENALIPPRKNLEVVASKEHKKLALDLADRYITLVKDTRNYLPMTPEKYKRIKLIYIGSDELVIAGMKFKSDDKEVVDEFIKTMQEKGFVVDSSLASKKGKMEEFKKSYDAVLLLVNVQGFAQYNTMRVKWEEPIMQPWYIGELPTFVVSTSFTNLLIDIPMARCYINSYMMSKESLDMTLSKLMGESEFKGRYNENVFCNRWETRL